MSFNKNCVFSTIALLCFTPLAFAEIEEKTHSIDLKEESKEIKEQLAEHFDQDVSIEGLEKAPFDEVYFFRVGGQAMMFIEEPRYLISGNIFDMETERNMSSDYMAEYYKDNFSIFNDEEYIIFEPDDRDIRHVVKVFTDPSCPYCTRMHQKIDEYNGYGIAIHYLPFPRGGQQGPGYDDMLKSWCSDEREDVLTAAKLDINQELINEQQVSSECRDEFDEIVAKSRDFGVTGTPAMFLETGHQVGGYLEPDVLLQKINEHASQ